MANFVFCLIFPVVWHTVSTFDCCKTTQVENVFHVTCRSCGLKTLPLELPENTTVLDLSYNHIDTIFKGSLKQLKNLHILHLEGNQLSTIEQGAFDELKNLAYLNLKYNKLNNSLNHLVFNSLSNLETLNLHENYFYLERAYPDIALSHLLNLQTLYIDMFEGFRFGKGFLNLTKLKEIRFHTVNTKAVSVKNSSFTGLTNSNISHLELMFRMRTFEKASLSPFKMLKSLTLDSHFTIPLGVMLQGLYGIRDKFMNSIVLQNNLLNTQVFTIRKHDMAYLGSICVKRLSLVRNGIVRIATNTVYAWEKISCIKVLNVSKNNLVLHRCFTILMVFPNITHADLSYQIDVEQVKRRSYKIERKYFLPKTLKFLNLSHNVYHSKIASFSIAENSLEVLDISHPELGTLYWRDARITGMTHLKELYISGIDCSSQKFTFANLPHLSKLEGISSNFGMHLQQNSTIFKGLSELSYVDFSSNDLQMLDPLLFIDQINSLETLVVAKNKLRHIPTSLLKHLNAVKTLDLTHNQITAISKTEFSFIEEIRERENKFQISLSGNPLLCTCDHLEFIRWINQTRAIVDKESIDCIAEDGKFVNFKRFLDTMDTFEVSCVSQFWLKVSIGLLTIFIALGILSILVWRYNVAIRIWCRKRKTGPYKYDLFVSYSHQDTDWFVNELIPRLEENNISYCCYDKTFNAGMSLVDNILDAIELSRKTVFLVTFNFIHSEWAKSELEYSWMFAFSEGRKDMIVVVLLEDIKCSEMPKTLRKIWDTINVSVWPTEDNHSERCLSDKRKSFWRNLLKSLPKRNNWSEQNVDESIV